MDVNVIGLSTLRKEEQKTRPNTSESSKKLQAYLEEQYGAPGTKKKNKKKKKKYIASQGLAIVDADIDTSRLAEVSPSRTVEDDEDAPVIVNAGEFLRLELQEQRQKELMQRNAETSTGGFRIQGESEHVNVSNEENSVSPPRRARHDSDTDSDGDVSPPRRTRHDSDADSDGDVSPPRRARHDCDADSDGDVSPPRRARHDSDADSDGDVSPPRRESELLTNEPHGRNRMSDGTLTGMISGKDLKKEMEDARRREREKFGRLDDKITGKNASTVYRSEDGRAMSKQEYLDDLKKKKDKEKKFLQGSEIPWGKGLKQTKDFQESQQPTLSVPSRWDDPMAHVLGRKRSDEVLLDGKAGSLLDMYAKDLKKAGFNVPLGVPSHSWIHRKIGPPPNRYGIKPGRHWDGVDRSNGFESQMFRRQAELKQRDLAAHYMAQEDM